MQSLSLGRTGMCRFICYSIRREKSVSSYRVQKVLSLKAPPITPIELVKSAEAAGLPLTKAAGSRLPNADTGHETAILFRYPCSTELSDIMFIACMLEK